MVDDICIVVGIGLVLLFRLGMAWIDYKKSGRVSTPSS